MNISQFPCKSRELPFGWVFKEVSIFQPLRKNDRIRIPDTKSAGSTKDDLIDCCNALEKPFRGDREFEIPSKYEYIRKKCPEWSCNALPRPIRTQEGIGREMIVRLSARSGEDCNMQIV